MSAISRWLPLLMLLIPPTVSASVSLGEYEALLSLYNSTNGDEWTNRGGWLSGSPCGSTYMYWYGVVCNYPENTEITEIRLRDNNLSGTLPDLEGLFNVNLFDVGWNAIGGSVPPSIVSLALHNLGTLRLEQNQFVGSVPDFSTTNIAELHLGFNNFSGTISPIHDMPNLKYFVVDHNNLDGTIAETRDLPVIHDYYVNDNSLTGTLPVLSHLTSLVNFHAQNNKLTGTIHPWTSPSGSFEAGGNDIQGTIPVPTGDTPSDQLGLSYNCLHGTVPDAIWELPLRGVNLESNNLTGTLPVAKPDMHDVQVAHNRFLCPHPEWCGFIGSNYYCGSCEGCQAAYTCGNDCCNLDELCVSGGCCPLSDICMDRSGSNRCGHCTFHDWWWLPVIIALCVVGICMAGVVVGVFYWRRRRRAASTDELDRFAAYSTNNY